MTYLAIFIFFLLCIASVFVGYQIKQNPSAETINNKKRLIVWWLIFVVCFLVFLSTFLFGPIAILLFVNALLCWIIFELMSLFKITINAKTLIFCIGVLISFSTLLMWYPQLSSILLILSIITAFLSFILPVTSFLYLPVFVLYCCASLFSLVLIAKLSEYTQLDYAYILLILFFITAVNDIAQYISGKLFGKTSIAPILSPNKTLAGVWGGILISSLLGVLLLLNVLQLSNLEAFAIGSLLSFSGLWGDLIVSKLKRGLKVKDSGNSISGHGGILDRLDSLLLTAPVFAGVLLLGGYL